MKCYYFVYTKLKEIDVSLVIELVISPIIYDSKMFCYLELIHIRSYLKEKYS